MRRDLKKRIVSLVLCVSIIATFFAQSSPVFAVGEDPLSDAPVKNPSSNTGKQAIFDWSLNFMLVDDPTREDIADIYWDTDTEQPHTDGEYYWYFYDEKFDENGNPTGEPCIGANGLVMQIADYYYDGDNGWHWYKVTGDHLPDPLVEKPWVLYCTDMDTEEGFDPYLCIYEKDEAIRFVYSENDSHYNYFVVAGPSALRDAEITITARDSDYAVSDLAYVELTYGTTFSKAFNITITKSDKEAWTPSDGIISIRYEATQLGSDTYTEFVPCGAGFVYVDGQMYSAAATDRWGYEISDVVYTNSGSSTLVFEHMLSNFEWVNLPGYFTKATIRMYSNTFETKECISADLPERVNVVYAFTYQDVPYFWLEHEDFIGSPYFIVKASDVILERTLTDYSGEVSVSGKIPLGVYLDMSRVSLDALAAVYPDPTPDYDYNIADTVPHVVYDLNVMLDGSKWQPSDGNKVTVTIDSEDLQLAPGDDYLVYHLHLDENGTPIPEWLGLFNSEKGEATFEMGRFSYVLVLNPGTITISNDVKAFYPVSSYAADPCELPNAGNGKWFIVGMYFGTDNTAHVLLGSNGKLPALDKIDYIEVDGQIFYNPDAKGYKPSSDKKEVTLTPYNKTVSKIDMQISDTETITVIDLAKVSNTDSFGAVLDICLDNTIDVGNEFVLSLKATTGGNNTDNSFNIGGLDVALYLEYNIQKEVALGTSANGSFAESVIVNRGDWVTYRIAINNTGTLPLEGMHLEDFLPEGVFDMSTVQVSLDGALTEGSDMSWQNWNGTDMLFEDYSCEGKFSHYVYIKAQVLTELSIDKDTTYTNTAEFHGMGMPLIQDTANIVVKAPVNGTLTVSKTVTTANPNDFPENTPAFKFAFTINSLTSGSTTTKIMLNGTEYTVTVGVPLAFSLNNGESAVFTGIPVGAQYTVTETGDSQYTTKVNGQEGYSFSGTMTEGGAPVAAFENQFKVREGAITVNKVVNKEYDYDVLPDDEFEFRIEFDENYRDMSFDYEIDGIVVGKIRHGGTIKIKGGQSFVILDYPNRTPYAITEVANDKYKTTVNGVATNVINGVSSTSGTSHTFTNTYNKVRTSLTINKVVNNVESDPIRGGQTFKFEITHPDGTVTYETITVSEEIPGGTETNPGKGYGSVTVHGLEVGTYTVREVEIPLGFACDWPSNTTTVALTTAGGEVTCTNRYPIYIVYYKAEIGGNVSADEAEFNMYTEKFDSSTAIPDNGYVFVGWYDENENLVSVEKEFAPGIQYDGQTLTAKFRASTTSLVIQKTGHANVDPNQTFLFQVTGENVNLTVTVHGNGSTTINGLKVGGQYTVTELTDWSWRYEFSGWAFASNDAADANGNTNNASVTLGTGGNVLTFTNIRDENKWLDGDSWLDNLFKVLKGN